MEIFQINYLNILELRKVLVLNHQIIKNAHAHCNWNNDEDTAAPIYVYIAKQTGAFDYTYGFKFNNTTMFTVHYYNGGANVDTLK